MPIKNFLSQMYSKKMSLQTMCCLVFNHLKVDNKLFNNHAMGAKDPEVSKVDKNKPNLSAEDTAVVDTTCNAGV